MENNSFPITPPEELVDQWNEVWIDAKVKHEGLVTFIATQAARWGADQELEACCVWLRGNDPYEHDYHQMLRAARRPKPPSHKELALIALTALEACAAQSSDTTESVFYIRRALESLPD